MDEDKRLWKWLQFGSQARGQDSLEGMQSNADYGKKKKKALNYRSVFLDTINDRPVWRQELR